MASNPFNLDDWVHRVEQYGKGKSLLEVCLWRNYPQDNVAIFCGLIPDIKIDEALKEVSWDVKTGDGGPSTWMRFQGNGQVEYGYSRDDESGYDPLVLYRNFHGIRDSYLEFSEEFRLYHQLYHLPDECRYVKIHEDGTESDAIVYTTIKTHEYLSASISRELLDEYCLVKQAHLAIYFDIQRTSSESLEELGLPPEGCRKFRKEKITLDQFWSQRFHRDKSCSILRGKRLFLGLPRDSLKPWQMSHETKEYESFVVSISDEGQKVKAKCGPELHKSGTFYTPVYFNKRVLDKYYADPDLYEVQDGYVSCAGLWGLKIDNNRDDCISAFLGDIGQMLSSQEQAYWRSFNIWPSRTGLSEAAYRRGVLGEFADPNSPEFIFRYRYEAFQKEDSKHSERPPLFEPLSSEDFHNLSALRIPSNNRQPEFDQQILALSKILVDSLSSKAISWRYLELSGTQEVATKGEDRTVQQLENLLTYMGAPYPRDELLVLRDIQALRSASAAHRKGSHFEKLQERMELKTKGLQQVFVDLIKRAITLLDYLQANLLS